MPQDLKPAIFVDRDGVLIENRDAYIRKPSHILVFPQAIEACKKVTDSGAYALVVVTNQSAIGRGIMSRERVWALNRRILRKFEMEGVVFAGSYICPHRPD